MLLRADEPSPTLKHLPTTILVVAAYVLTVAVADIGVTDYPSLWASIGAIAISTGLAAFFTAKPQYRGFAVLVPCIDLIAIAFLRLATGGATSLFSGLLILPIVWIAAERGRRHILIAGVGVAIALMLPYLLGVAPLTGPSDWLRGIISPVVFAVAATIINEMSRQSRLQVNRVRALAEEKESMLKGAVTYAERLRENEELLTQAEYFTRSVLDSVTEQSVIGTDVTGLIDVWNPGAERMLGISSTETQGRRYIYEFHDDDELSARSKALNYPPGETVLTPGFSALVESARLGTPEVRQWTYRRADETTVAVEVAVTRRADQTGATVGYIFVATDVTQALEVARLKDEFVGLISHELRTPLSSILGYLELMRDDDENPLSGEQLQYLGVAERNAHRLLRLVGDLLFTAQVGSSTFSLDASLVDIGPIVTASVESAKPVAANAGVRISADILTGGQQILGDPVRLAQACDNLLSNAIKFTPRGGSVAIIVAVTGASLEVTITDTGMGIPEDELDNLFARFFRASTATRAAVPGVGLGLTITKAIVVAHGGELDVTSMVGVGTSFVVRLPIPTEG